MAQLDPEHTPVIVGVGQSFEREHTVSPSEMIDLAVDHAVGGSPLLLDQLDRITFVDHIFSQRVDSPATALSTRLGLKGVQCELSRGGGNSPPYLVSRAAQAIANGECRCVLVAGGEASRSAMLESRAGGFQIGSLIDESRALEGQPLSNDGDTLIGPSAFRFVTETERAGLDCIPVEMFALLESARMHLRQISPEDQQNRIGKMLHRFCEIAVNNPHAHQRQALSPSDIAIPTGDNRVIADPYTKRMCAYPFVDQAAAVVVTSLAVARSAGVADQCVFIRAGATSEDGDFVAKASLGDADVMRLAVQLAVQQAGVLLDDIEYFDLYSAFPVCIDMLSDALSLTADDSRDLTVTGGMPFFGGPGSNYSMHGIAGVYERILKHGGHGLVFGVTGWVSKGSVGIYSSDPGERTFADRVLPKVSGGTPLASRAEGSATVVAGTLVHGKNGDIAKAPIIADLDDGRRIAAQADPSLLNQLRGVRLTGQNVDISGHPPRYRISS